METLNEPRPTDAQIRLILKLGGNPGKVESIKLAEKYIDKLIIADFERRYEEKLAALPPPGDGAGFHSLMLGVATLGARAGMNASRIIHDLTVKADQGSRVVPPTEISMTVEKAFKDAEKEYKPPAILPRRTLHAESVLPALIRRGREYGEHELRKCSPVRLGWEPAEAARNLIRHLYRRGDIMFIGNKYDSTADNIKPAAEWFEKGNPGAYPHVIPNPLTGMPGAKKDGSGGTLRGDACVTDHRFIVVEFDDMPREEQLAFWCGCPFPVAALIESGGKSVHGWIQVNVANAEEWDAKVRPFFKTHLEPLGVDKSCSNPSRLSRLPGHYRTEKGKWQHLLFLDPEARGPRFYLEGGRA